MPQNINKSRWYDSSPEAAQVLDFIKNMDSLEREEFASHLIKVVNIVKSQNIDEKTTVSIGKDKVLDYYQAFNKRRWYDTSPNLMRAMNSLNLIPEQEKQQIIEGILSFFENENFS